MSVDVKQSWGYKSFDRGLGRKQWAKPADRQQKPINSDAPAKETDVLVKEEGKIPNEKFYEALRERDSMWQKHEKLQVEYLQKQHSHLLAGLHSELERLQNINRDLERQLFVNSEPSKSEFDKVKNELSAEKNNNSKLRKEMATMSRRNACLAQTLEKTAHLYKCQIAQYEKKIAKQNERLKEIMSHNPVMCDRNLPNSVEDRQLFSSSGTFIRHKKSEISISIFKYCAGL
ncbi:hypothetical protein Ddc_00717 [Ditylenchus destructor]|nr:hypothetical protein Ddc_00717 [Ditylenchus destructor]